MLYTLCFIVDSNEGETDDSKNGTNCTTNSGSCVGELQYYHVNGYILTILYS